MTFYFLSFWTGSSYWAYHFLAWLRTAMARCQIRLSPVLDRFDTGEDDQFVTSDIREHLVQLMPELENVAAGTFDWQAPCA